MSPAVCDTKKKTGQVPTLSVLRRLNPLKSDLALPIEQITHMGKIQRTLSPHIDPFDKTPQTHSPCLKQHVSFGMPEIDSRSKPTRSNVAHSFTLLETQRWRVKSGIEHNCNCTTWTLRQYPRESGTCVLSQAKAEVCIEHKCSWFVLPCVTDSPSCMSISIGVFTHFGLSRVSISRTPYVLRFYLTECMSCSTVCIPNEGS